MRLRYQIAATMIGVLCWSLASMVQANPAEEEPAVQVSQGQICMFATVDALKQVTKKEATETKESKTVKKPKAVKKPKLVRGRWPKVKKTKPCRCPGCYGITKERAEKNKKAWEKQEKKNKKQEERYKKRGKESSLKKVKKKPYCWSCCVDPNSIERTNKMRKWGYRTCVFPPLCACKDCKGSARKDRWQPKENRQDGNENTQVKVQKERTSQKGIRSMGKDDGTNQ